MFIRQYPLTYEELSQIDLVNAPHNKGQLQLINRYPQFCPNCSGPKKCYLFWLDIKWGKFLSFACSTECAKYRRGGWAGQDTLEIKLLNCQEIFTLQCLINQPQKN